MPHTTQPQPTRIHASRALVSLDDALQTMLAAAHALPEVQSLPLAQADGRVLAADCIATQPVPPLDNAGMDGYAVRSADLAAMSAQGIVLPVVSRIAAGEVGVPLPAGCAARIFTGAPLPLGADAVVMQEDCEALNAPESSPNPGRVNAAFLPTLRPDVLLDAALAPRVRIRAAAVPGQWVRRAGQDIAAGSVALSAGTRLTPAAIGLAASLGLASLPVRRAPRVALFSTGDELVEPGSMAAHALPTGHIFNSNRFVLTSLLTRLGCEVTDGGILPDALDATTAALHHAAQSHDLVLTSAGASVGEEDHIAAAVATLGEVRLHKIAMKPGKPLAWGMLQRENGSAAHFIGLPGNPVSSLVSCLLLVRPFVLKLQGAVDVLPRSVQAVAAFDWLRSDARREFLRVRANEAGQLVLFANQNSGVLSSTVWADGLVDCPPHTPIRAGDAVRFIPFAQLWA